MKTTAKNPGLRIVGNGPLPMSIPMPTFPSAPEHLSADAKSRWDKIVQEFRVSDSPGLLLLQTALESYDEMQQARAEIAKTGLVCKDKNGRTHKNRLLSIKKDAAGQFLRAMKQLDFKTSEPKRRRP